MTLNKHTICSAAIRALLAHGKPMTADEIYNSIITDNLYIFRAKKPLSVLKAELRKHSEGAQGGIRSKSQFFKLISSQSYWVVDKQIS